MISTARRALLATAVAGVALGGAAAHADWPNEMVVNADAATDRGFVNFHLRGPAGAHATVIEHAAGKNETLATVDLNADGLAYLPKVSRWRCDRITRRFYASTTTAESGLLLGTFSLRTPSCRHRLTIRAPNRVRPGANVRLRVHDTWNIGGLPMRLCVKPPKRRARCRALDLAEGVLDARARFRASRRGIWKIALLGKGLDARDSVAVGVKRSGNFRFDGADPPILVTGDSLVQGMDAILQDRLADRARVRSDVRPGTGLTKIFLDWVKHSRAQARRYRPAATVIFIGGGDALPMITPAGQKIECCDTPWIDEYARRARRMMRAYLAPKDGPVIWLALPAPRDRDRTAAYLAVNIAVRQAALGLANARVLPTDSLFTPNFVYRDVMMYKGRRVRVRSSDGFHLSVEGSRIAASKVIAALERAGVL